MAADAPADELRKFDKALLFGARIVMLVTLLMTDKKFGFVARRPLGTGIK